MNTRITFRKRGKPTLLLAGVMASMIGGATGVPAGLVATSPASAANGRPAIALIRSAGGTGYGVVTSDGARYDFGTNYTGGVNNIALAAPIVDAIDTPDGRGTWYLGADGGIFTTGTAPYRQNPIKDMPGQGSAVALVRSTDGTGYAVVTSNGARFDFGTNYTGGVNNIALAAPIVDAIDTPDGRGTWYLGADGGIFTTGTAPFNGNPIGDMGGTLRSPNDAVGLQYPPSMQSVGNGYYRMPDPAAGDPWIWASNTPASERCGSKELVGMLYTTAREWSRSNPGGRLVIGDMNAAGHLSHRNGIDVDVRARVGSSWAADSTVSGYSRTLTKQLAETFARTGVMHPSNNFWNPTNSRDEINASPVLKARGVTFKYWVGHYNHFHIRLRTPKLATRTSC